MNFNKFPLNTFKVHDLTKSFKYQSDSQKTLSSWIAHDGKDRGQIPSLLELCLKGKRNILFGKFMNEKSTMFILDKLDTRHRREFGLVGFLTSGSTGQKRLILHNIETLVESAYSLFESYPELEGRTTYSAFPTSYMAGILNNFLVPLVANSPIVLDNSFDFSTPFRVARIFEEFKVEWAWMSPGVLQGLSSQVARFQPAHQLKLILSATGPLNHQLRSSLASSLQIRILNTYGLTEVLFVSGERDMKNHVSLGKPFSGVEIEITGHQQILIQTRTLPLCIYQLMNTGDIKLLENTDKGFFLTSDLAVNQDGELRLLGRLDDIVVLRGVNVSLSEIELAAQDCKGVLASCAREVVGPFGNDIELLIELGTNVNESITEIRKHLLTVLSPDCMPGAISFANLPRLDSGKVDRFKIRSLT